MGIESATYISDLNEAWPLGSDLKSTLDNHHRLTKAAIKTTFPNVTGAVTPTHVELNYVDGVTSAIQTQIDTKAPSANPTFTGNVALPSTTVIGNVSATELGYLDGVTSAIQTQIDTKSPLASPTFTGTPAAPTATSGTNTTQLATTAFVQAAAFNAGLPNQTGNSDKIPTTDGTNASWTASLKATILRWVDGTDTTKKLAFDLTGISTGTTRTLAVPDANATILTTAAAVTVPQGGTGLTTLTSGSLLVGAGTSTPTFLAPGSNGNIAVVAGGVWTSAAPAAAAFPYLYMRDEKASGTAGGTFTSGSFQTRVLNTTIANTISGGSLASNQITLPAGTYQVLARAPGVQTDQHKLKFRNVTDSTDTLIGSGSCTNNGSIQTDVWVMGSFTIAGAKAFELQHRTNTTSTTVGLGLPMSFSVVEVYAEVFITKVA